MFYVLLISGENRNMDSFWSSSPAGKIDEKYSKIADYTIGEKCSR